PRYYGPVRHPGRPGLSLAGVRSEVTRLRLVGASRVACISLVSTCRCHYPGGIVGSNRSWDGLFHPFPCSPTTTAFPTPLAGRLPHRCLSRLVQHSLALPPADSLHRRAAHLSRRLRRLCYLPPRSDSFRPERLSWPGETCPHWETPPFTAHNGDAARP